MTYLPEKGKVMYGDLNDVHNGLQHIIQQHLKKAGRLFAFSDLSAC